MKEKVNFQVLESYLDEYKLEYSLIGANFKDKDIEVAEIAAYWIICLEKNLRYVEEQGLFCTKDRQDTTKFRGHEIRRSKDRVSGIFWTLFVIFSKRKILFSE
ncbi:MAG TPA: hypothetical protein VK250_01470 [Nitrososphaeraceae archaeon]|nr:hypothetical protein [Nitrososphaeraceae archaeon]